MKKMSTFIAVSALSLALVAASAAFAGGSHDHSPKFGGIVTAGKAFDAELVAKPDLITVYVSDHGKSLSTKGAKGKITLLSGADKTEFELIPAGDDRMEAKGKFNVSKGTKAVVMIEPQGKKPGTLRFEIK